MKNQPQCGFANLSATGLLCAALACPLPTIAQTTDEDGEFVALEEVVVTGRKREESLQEVPVAVAVLGESLLAEQNVIRQGDLAELVPGYHYNQGVGLSEDRTAALPSIRGIGSTELATNRAKVASFVDGMPILGSIGAINIGGATRVEVYSGPQSAAFGRSTFAGAINYITADPGDTLEGDVGLNWSSHGTRIVNGSLGGPITGNLGFLIGASIEDSSSPDTDLYSYTDGVEALAETGENLSARFVFEPNDQFRAKLTFARDTTDDGPRADFYASAESSYDCYTRNNPFNERRNPGPPNNIAFDGVFECELEVHPETVLEQLNDIPRYLENNPDELAAVVANLKAQGAMDGHLGLTVEEQALIVYDGYSVRHGDSGSESVRDRVTAQFDYLLDNGSALQFSVMNSAEDLGRRYSRIAEQELQTFRWNPAAGIYDNYAPMNGRRVAFADPTTIDENYAEVRWASPGEDRLRYVFGASYYDYEYILNSYRNAGFANIASGTAEEFEALTGIPVEVTTIQSEVTTNTALFFNASYDFSDTVTGSLEGRYATDDVGAVLPLVGLEESVVTNSFTPRIALNWTPNENTTYYVQYSVGVNPAGINADMIDPLVQATLDNGIPIDLDPTDGDPSTTNIISVNYDSSRYLSFDEEELTNYEFGFKGDALDGRLTYAGAVYFMKWDNALQNINIDWDYPYADDDLAGTLVLQDDGITPVVPNVYYVPETDFTSAGVFTNTGESDTVGLELQTSYQVNNNWSLSGNVSLMQREFTEYCSEDDYLGYPNERGVYAGLELGSSEAGNPCWVLNGLEVANQPSLQMTVIPRYRTTFDNGLRFTASARIRHVGQYYREFTNTTEAAAVTRVGLNFSLARDAWSAILYVDNLLDVRTMIPRGATSLNRFNQLNAPAVIPAEYQFAFQGGPWASFRFSPNEGRSFGFRMSYDFGIGRE